MSEIPSVKALEAISPTNAATGEDELTYNGLVAAVDRYALTNRSRSAAFWGAEEGSPGELSKARQLALEYMLRTAQKVIESHQGNRDLWADRFTLASVELYGEPERVEMSRLLIDEYSSLVQLLDNPNVSQEHIQFLLDEYKPIIAAQDNKLEVAEDSANREKVVIRQYGEVIRKKYQGLFDLVDEADKDRFTAQDIQELFITALDWLKNNDDPEWSNFKAVIGGGTSLKVLPGSGIIEIGSRREIASRDDVRGLVAHELLVHALRAINGRKTGDKKLASGLGGYLDAEEGLGILAEEAINGVLPDKAYDRYADVALALGTVDGIQRSRKSMFQISYARQLVRAQIKGADELELADLPQKVWKHIDRIYRGGKGDNVEGRQAIFTREVIYYVGYRQMAEYLVRQFDSGKSAEEVFTYLSQGKFDPDNPQHVAYLTDVAIS